MSDPVVTDEDRKAAEAVVIDWNGSDDRFLLRGLDPLRDRIAQALASARRPAFRRTRQEGYTASCDSCGRSWRAYECREKEAELRDGLRVDDWWITPTEHGIEVYCPRCDGEAMAAGRFAALAAERDRLKERERQFIAACGPVCDGGQYRADVVSAIERIKAERDAARDEVERLKDALASHAIQCPQVMGPVMAALSSSPAPAEPRKD